MVVVLGSSWDADAAPRFHSIRCKLLLASLRCCWFALRPDDGFRLLQTTTFRRLRIPIEAHYASTLRMGLRMPLVPLQRCWNPKVLPVRRSRFGAGAKQQNPMNVCCFWKQTGTFS